MQSAEQAKSQASTYGSVITKAIESTEADFSSYLQQ